MLQLIDWSYLLLFFFKWTMYFLFLILLWSCNICLINKWWADRDREGGMQQPWKEVLRHPIPDKHSSETIATINYLHLLMLMQQNCRRYATITTNSRSTKSLSTSSFCRKVPLHTSKIQKSGKMGPVQWNAWGGSLKRSEAEMHFEGDYAQMGLAQDQGSASTQINCKELVVLSTSSRLNSFSTSATVARAEASWLYFGSVGRCCWRKSTTSTFFTVDVKKMQGEREYWMSSSWGDVPPVNYSAWEKIVASLDLQKPFEQSILALMDTTPGAQILHLVGQTTGSLNGLPWPANASPYDSHQLEETQVLHWTHASSREVMKFSKRNMPTQLIRC